MSVNKFCDLTHDEFEEKILHKSFTNSNIDKFVMNGTIQFETIMLKPLKSIPNEMDWRKYGVVSPVKNQHHCGACWSFAATGAIEAQYYMKHKKMVTFSEQNLIDCSRPYGTVGCSGGLAFHAFEYVKDWGLVDEDSYPYQSADWMTCQTSDGNFSTKIDDYGLLLRNNETNLMYAVAEMGPIAISYLINSGFQHYRHGVFYHDRCRTGMHHAVYYKFFKLQK